MWRGGGSFKPLFQLATVLATVITPHKACCRRLPGQGPSLTSPSPTAGGCMRLGAQLVLAAPSKPARLKVAGAPSPAAAGGRTPWRLRAQRFEELHTRAASLNSGLAGTADGLPLRDYHIGAPFGAACLLAAAAVGTPAAVVGVAGAALLCASWESWRLWRQQQIAYHGFLYWFAGAVVVVAYQLGGLTASPAVHPALRLLVPATVLASVAYGMSAGNTPGDSSSGSPRSSSGGGGGSGRASSSVSGGGGGGASGGPPPGRKEGSEREGRGKGPSPAKPQALRSTSGAGVALATAALSNVMAPSALSPAAASSSNSSHGAPGAQQTIDKEVEEEGHSIMNDSTRALVMGATAATAANGVAHGHAHLQLHRSSSGVGSSLDEEDLAAIDKAVHSAFEHELEGVSDVVTQAVEAAVENAVENAIAESNLHFDVKANFNTLIVITGVILYWRGIWTGWDVLFGFSIWSQVACLMLGLAIMVVFRILKLPLAEGFPSG